MVSPASQNSDHVLSSDPSHPVVSCMCPFSFVLHVSDLYLSRCHPSESSAQGLLHLVLAQRAPNGPGLRAALLATLS